MSNTSTKMTRYVELQVAGVTGVELNVDTTVVTSCQGDQHVITLEVVLHILDIVLTPLLDPRTLSSS